MRKIVITGVAAVLALGLTACTGNGDDGFAAPSSSPFDAMPAPSGTSAPGDISTPDAPSAPSSTTAPQNPSSSDTPHEQPIGEQITSKWGQLRYLAPGKFIVDNVVFFTALDTPVYVAGGTCPDGSTPPDDSKCSIDGFDEWVQEAPHNAVVEFSGQAATLIRETQ